VTNDGTLVVQNWINSCLTYISGKSWLPKVKMPPNNFHLQQFLWVLMKISKFTVSHVIVMDLDFLPMAIVQTAQSICVKHA
jgi:hypothetical protein